MKNRKTVIEALRIAIFLLALAGFLSAPAGLGRASDAEGSMGGNAAGTREATDNAVKPEGPGDQAAIPTAAQEDAPEIAGPKEKVSYALGMTLGNQFKEKSIEVDLDLYVRGLRDGFSGGKTLLTEAEARSVVDALQRDLRRKRAAPQVPGSLKDIAVSFKLDPRITRALYMGDRWVSRSTHRASGPDGTVIVDARAEGRDAKGHPLRISPEWTPKDPVMVTVAPHRGKQVRITVLHEGETRLKVVSQGVSKELSIKAVRNGDTMQVEISQ